MKLKDLLSLKISLSGGSSGETFDDTEFRRIIETKVKEKDEDTGLEEEVIKKSVRVVAPGLTGRKNFITLVPMKSLSLENFSFPFSNSTKIREALKLQVMPFSAAGELEIFPVVLSKKGRGVSGIVWYVSPEELNIPETNKILPAPLPFVSRLSQHDGTGVTMWVDEENVCSMLWQEYKPVMSRWRKLLDEHTEEKELAWYDNYCKAREIERGGNFVVHAFGDNADDEPDEEFYEIVNESVQKCPWIANVNLSRSAIEGARDLERSVKFLTRASCWVLFLGIIMLASSLLRWNQLQKQIQEIRTRSENFYRQTFDASHTGRIANPVNLARDRIASLTGTTGEAHSIDEVFADLGEIFSGGKNNGITLDIIRYNADGIDCTGTAPDMTTILNFRKAWQEYAETAQVDNTQFVSGIGYRFDLRVRW